jgi:hypothetical protein
LVSTQVDDLPTPVAYDAFPDARLHPHSVITRKRRVRARRAFVKTDWTIRGKDHEEPVPCDDADLDDDDPVYRRTWDAGKRPTFTMGPGGVHNATQRMTEKRSSTLARGLADRLRPARATTQEKTPTLAFLTPRSPPDTPTAERRPTSPMRPTI